MVRTKPSAKQGTSRITVAAGRRSGQRSTKSAGPPWAAIIWPNFSAAAPDSSAWAMRLAPSAASWAKPPKASASPPKATVISHRAVLTDVPVRVSITSVTSSALPAAVAKGCDISVISAVVMQPAPWAVVTRARAKASACSSVFIKAPEPHFTSKTSASNPAASFLDRIEAVIRSMLSTVPVTSRMAYSLRSAGAISALAETMAQPICAICRCNCASDRPVRKPGMASSLSSVPPVWPKPRPEIIGT